LIGFGAGVDLGALRKIEKQFSDSKVPVAVRTAQGTKEALAQAFVASSSTNPMHQS